MKARLSRQRPFRDIVRGRCGQEGQQGAKGESYWGGGRAQAQVLPEKKGSWAPEMVGEVGMHTDEIHHCQVKKRETFYLMTPITQGHLWKCVWRRTARESHASPTSLGLEEGGELKTASQKRLLSWGPSWGWRSWSVVTWIHSVVQFFLGSHQQFGCGPRMADGWADSRSGFRKEQYITFQFVSNMSSVGPINSSKFSTINIGYKNAP